MSKQVTKVETQYQWHELSDSAKDNARFAYWADYNWADEALNSLKALAEHFGGNLSDYSIDWSNSSYSSAKFSMPELEYDEAKELIDSLGSYNPETLRGNGDCKLTGVCFDEDAIDGAREYVFNSDAKSFDANEMMQSAYSSWIAACWRDYEDQLSDESIADSCEANDYWFDENGNLA